MENSFVLSASVVDAFRSTVPTEKRKAVWNKSRTFAEANPKLAIFLLINVLMTGTPFLCFLAFAAAVFVSSLTVAVFTTGFIVFIASLLALPLIFCTTTCAIILFLWGLASFYLFVYLQNTGNAPSKEVIADKFHRWTGFSHPGDTERKHRPLATPKDSAIALGKRPIEMLDGPSDEDNHEGVASETSESPNAENAIFDTKVEYFAPPNPPADWSAHSVCSSGSSLQTIIGPTSAGISPKTSVANTKNAMAGQSSENPASTAPITGAGLPQKFIKLRKEHPEGLRIDSNGLYKVDDIASDSSMDDTIARERLIKSRSTGQRRTRGLSDIQNLPQDVPTGTILDTPFPPAAPMTDGTRDDLDKNMGVEVLEQGGSIIPENTPRQELEASQSQVKENLSRLTKNTVSSPSSKTTSTIAVAHPNSAVTGTKLGDLNEQSDSSSGKSSTSEKMAQLMAETSSGDELNIGGLSSSDDDMPQGALGRLRVNSKADTLAEAGQSQSAGERAEELDGEVTEDTEGEIDEQDEKEDEAKGEVKDNGKHKERVG